MNAVVVQKYGGSSVATPDKIKQVAAAIKQKREQGFGLCVVVSAMGKTTNELLSLAHQVTPNPSRRELDMLLTCGERASMALLAMALEDMQVPSISLTGSQSGIITDDVHSGAKIIELRPVRVRAELALGKVVIVAGFQGISHKKEITTLGRGGSDTTAVALAAALEAEACEIYSDVAGIYSADPRVVLDAERIALLSHGDMELLAAGGAKVLNAEAVRYAKNHGVTIHAKKTGDDDTLSPGTLIGAQTLGAKPKHCRVAFAHRTTQHCLSVSSLADARCMSEYLFARGCMPGAVVAGALSLALGSAACGGVLICIAPEDAHGLEKALQAAPSPYVLESLGSVTMVPLGASEPADQFLRAWSVLVDAGIEIRGLLNSQSQATFFMETRLVEPALKILHTYFAGCCC